MRRERALKIVLTPDPWFDYTAFTIEQTSRAFWKFIGLSAVSIPCPISAPEG
jgi:hypothetical protein